MDQLTDAELKSLRLVVEKSPPADAIPPEHARKLIDLDFVEARRAGLVATGKGRMRAKTGGLAKA